MAAPVRKAVALMGHSSCVDDLTGHGDSRGENLLAIADREPSLKFRPKPGHDPKCWPNEIQMFRPNYYSPRWPY